MIRGVTASAAAAAGRASAAARRAFSTGKHDMPVIVAANRTPIGSIQGSLAQAGAVQLGTTVVKNLLERTGLDPNKVSEAIMGNVISANLGQAPTRQVVVNAGLPWTVPCTTVNKVCASGMKSVTLAAQSIMLGHNTCVVAGGFESMTNAPFYVPKARAGYPYGHGELLDALVKDGLTDAFDNHHMGMCAEDCSAKQKISREEQDKYAIESYRRSAAAAAAGYFKDEIVPVEIKTKKGVTVVSEDEEYKRVVFEKVPKLQPAFKKDGTVTAANSSSLNDGAAGILVTSAAFAREHGLKPIARILGFGDAERRSIEFTIAPSDAVPIALRRAGLTAQQVHYWEVNEAFAVVALANQRLLKLDLDKLNVFGGGVSLGHPIGASGARIITTLINVLNKKDASIGCASICNGGGGATAIVIERL